jgi:glyoxylase-like metal-dependent hydrolase (beta-lactamase superfamily II)
MFFKQFYLGCLAHASYLIGSEGEAAVVDPRRDVDEYLAEATAQGLTIKYVIETHLHADFVSGHRELSERTGATIVFGAKAGAAFPHLAVKDDDEIRLGSIMLRFVETPGHTPESISVVAFEAPDAREPRLLLTGDTLFIGDVGRPDLAGGRGFTPAAMAEMLYDSLHGKLLKLPDAVQVFPAHGAGSLCGRNMSKETSSTIGEQRRANYALQPMAREEFVRMMTSDLPEQPRYFSMDVEINRDGAAPLAEKAAPAALTPDRVRALAEQGATLLDVRQAAAFGTAHVPGSINVALAGQFASWAGTLLDAKAAIVIVSEDESGAREAALRLSRVGLENVAGFLEGGVAEWDEAGLTLARLPQIPVDELRARLAESGSRLQVLDVRRPGEFSGGHVPGAKNVPLDRVDPRAGALDRSRPTAVVCAGGYRSSAAASLLLRNGHRDLLNVVGGTSAWVAAGFEVER